MSGAIDAEISAKIEVLRLQFVRRMTDDARLIQSCCDEMGAQAAADAQIGPLRKICHSLCGAAGIFGYPAVAEAASRMSAEFAAGERKGDRLKLFALSLVGEIQIAIASSCQPMQRGP